MYSFNSFSFTPFTQRFSSFILSDSKYVVPVYFTYLKKSTNSGLTSSSLCPPTFRNIFFTPSSNANSDIFNFFMHGRHHGNQSSVSSVKSLILLKSFLTGLFHFTPKNMHKPSNPIMAYAYFFYRHTNNFISKTLSFQLVPTFQITTKRLLSNFPLLLTTLSSS